MTDGAMSWDSVIEKDSQFTILPAGEYNYRVDSVEKSEYAGGANIGPCPKAIVSLTVFGQNDQVQIKENFLLHFKLEWKLCEFFVSTGLREKGGAVAMPWNRVEGATGRLKLKVDKYQKNDGTQGEANRVDKFLEPMAGAQPVQQQAPQQAPQPTQQWEVPGGNIAF